MARPPALLPDADALRARIDARGRLALKVTPGAREESVTLTPEAVLVKVRAAADKGAANQAVLELVARALGRGPARGVRGRGGTARQTVVALELYPSTLKAKPHKTSAAPAARPAASSGAARHRAPPAAAPVASALHNRP